MSQPILTETSQPGIRGPHPDTYNSAYIWSICLVAAMGGLLFGYDWIVIGGAKVFYETYFHLTTPMQIGWATSSALVGCLVGAIISGGLSDRFGRKNLLILAAAVFLISSIGTGMANTFNVFTIWRLLGGTAIGLASNLSPMYIAEVAPASIRGRLVSINQLTIVIGILAAQIVNYLIARRAPDGASPEFILNSWYGQYAWRWMFGVTAIPSLLFFAGMFFVPESPRWLAKNGNLARARDILARIGGPAYADAAVGDIEQTLVNENKKVNFGQLLEPKMLRILILGVAVAVFQQWCGINVIFYYAHDIFRQAGYNISAILFNIAIIGAVNLLTTLIAIYAVDRIGRPLLMLFGAAGLAAIFTLMGISFTAAGHALPVRTLVLLSIGCYGCSLAPITWVVIAEIFPNRIRGAAMSVSVSALWVACFILTYTFPLLNEKLGMAGTFWMYAAVCAVGFVFILARLPETKGKTLEEIERILVD